MAKEKRVWGLALIAAAMVMIVAGCATSVPISAVRAPTIDTQGIQRMGIKNFENASGSGVGTSLAAYLTTQTKQVIQGSGKFTMVDPSDPQVDGVFTGRVTQVGSKDDAKQTTRQDKNGNTVTETTYTREVSLEFEYSVISARTNVEIGTVTKRGNRSSSASSPGGLESVETLARRIIDRELNGFGGDFEAFKSDIIPTIVTSQRKLMDETSKDKVVKTKMKEALKLVKAGNYQEAIKLYDAIAAEHNSPAARTNAGILRESINTAASAQAELVELFQDKDGTVEKALKGVFGVLDAKLSAGSTITIVKQQSTERSMLDYVVDEMTKTIVKAGAIKVMDRSNQALIEAEQRFQTSGAVSDDSMVSLGKQLGVKYMVFCWISGEKSLRRLNLKVLDIETGQIMDQSAFEI